MQGLRNALERLGLKQAELARLLNVSPRTVSLWATGSVALPGPVAAYLRVLEAAGSEVLSAELRRLGGRSKMLDEGLYGLAFRAEDDGAASGGDGLAVLRNGKILGSDREGAVFSGSYDFDPVNETNNVHVRLSMPPGGRLVTGYEAGPKGATLDITGAFARAAPVSTIEVKAAGRPIEVRLTYLGPLPN